MKKTTITLSLLFLTFTIFAQNRESRNLGSFNELSVSEAVKVELVKGNSEKAEVEVTGTDAKNVLTELTGKRLKIHMASGNWRNVNAFVRLTYRSLEEIDVSSAGQLSCEEAITSDDLEIDVSSAGKADLVFKVGTMEVDVSSAGSLDAEGSANDIEVDVSSAGTVDAYDLECRNAELSASSAGTLKITVTEQIEANANSGGSIRYRGTPEKVRVSNNSGGSVHGSDQ